MTYRRTDPVLARHPPPPPPPSSSSFPESTQTWIVQYHQVWSNLIHSPFYQRLEQVSLNATQFSRWLLDCTSVSLAVVEAATRTDGIMRSTTSSCGLPLLSVAKENAFFLSEFAIRNGLNINSRFRLSHAGKRLVDVIETCTAPDALPAVAITAVWSCMLSSWQAWNLCIELNRPIPPRFKDFAIYFGRDDCIGNLLETQAIINHQLKDCAGSQVFEKAGKTFEEIAQRSCDLLDHTLHMADTNQVPVCTCGRKGHLPQQCTFKSHI